MPDGPPALDSTAVLIQRVREGDRFSRAPHRAARRALRQYVSGPAARVGEGSGRHRRSGPEHPPANVFKNGRLLADMLAADHERARKATRRTPFPFAEEMKV